MLISSYAKFIRFNARLLGFGFLMTFASSFGQTYFIGVFGPSIQAEFGLSHSAWGMIYMAGTLASATLLPWSGKKIDLIDLRLYTLIVITLLAIACFSTAAIFSPLILVLAIFLIRHSGQGLASHTSITTMARYFDASRGRAIAIATLGISVGQAILPFLAVLSIYQFNWRWSYSGVGCITLFIMLPLALWLLKGHTERHIRHTEQNTTKEKNGEGSVLSWNRTQVLHDGRFWLMLPGICASPLILTAMFFHHLSIAEAKGWSAAWITGNYVVYSISIVAISLLIIGPLIDKLGALRLVPVMLLPLTLAMLVIGSAQQSILILPYFILAGASSGISMTAVSAMWAELYGTLHLGAIKSLVAALQVFASALGPVIMGTLMDLEVSIQVICYIFALTTLVGTGSMYIAKFLFQNSP